VLRSADTDKHGGITHPIDLTSSSQLNSTLDRLLTSQLDRDIDSLSDGSKAWAALPLIKRAALLGEVRRAMIAGAQEWAETAAAIKGLDSSSQFVGEEWMSGPYASIAGVGKLAQSVAMLAEGTSPLANIEFGIGPDTRVTIPVLPVNKRMKYMLHGFSAEVWMPPGQSADQIRASAGLAQLTPGRSGGVGVVLGAGNVTSIPALDVIYEIVANNRAVILKLNPVMAGMKTVFDAAMEPLIRFDVLRIVQGGADVGRYLVQHPGIGHVHITGSAATHSSIVWGTGKEAARRRTAHSPLLTKPITSELGGVSPIIIVPSAWSRRDLRYQAEHVVTQRLHNGGYNCIAGQVVVVSSDWPQKNAFLSALRRALDTAPDRPAWYPGSDARVEAASTAYPAAERVGQHGGRLLIEVGAGDDASNIMTTEYFSPVLGVVEVAGTGKIFLDAAVKLANEEFVGTLGANVIVAPKMLKQLGAGFTEAIARLRYGTIGINAWMGLGFLTSTIPWGAFPGATIEDTQSGIGIVHNALLIDRPERAVLRGPFRPFPRSFAHGEFTLFPKPPWFVQSRSAAATGRLWLDYAAGPKWRKIPAIYLSEFRA
jgi:aldehyde dehydrogenase (NAD(P)+)